jgi:hypothetical protein
MQNNYEIAARYTQVELFSNPVSSRTSNEYTIGVSKYIVGHMLKWQSDISYLTDQGSSDGEIRFRIQLEMGI